MIFYGCMHILFIKTCIYCLGGVAICYSRLFYAVLLQYFAIFKRFVLFVIICRIVATLGQITEIETKRKGIAIWILGCLDLITDTILYLLMLNGTISDEALRIYGLIVDLIALLLFAYFTLALMRKLPHVLRELGMTREIKQWYVFIIIMSVAFLLRVENVIFILLSAKSSDSFKSSIGYAIYQAIYFIMTEIILGAGMVWMMSSEETLQQTNTTKQPLNN